VPMTRTPEQHPGAPEDGGAPGAPPAVPESVTSRWIVAVSVMFGTFMSVLDVTVVNVALPHMMGSFGRTLSEITWVATSYSIAEIIMATMAGWWSTVIGRKRLYIISLAIFTVGSIMAGTSQSFAQMMVYRVLQGVGGGALIPVSLAILRETFPVQEQGLAMSLYGMGVVLAPAIGPVLGGWLTDTYGWPWIFYINIPVGIAGITMVSLFLEDPHYLRRGVRRIDWTGIALLTAGLTGLQVVLERGQEYNWFESAWIVAGAVATTVSLIFLVWWELRVSEPVINVRLLRNAALGGGSAIGLLFGVALYGSTFLLPAMLQTLLGYDAFHAGITLLPRAATIFLMMPIVGWVYNYFDGRLLITLGVALIVWAFNDLAHLSTAVSFDHLLPILVVMGLGMPFQFVTLTTVSISTISRESMTDASSLYTLSRRVGGNIGYALMATLVERRTQFHRAQLVANLTVTNQLFTASSAGLAALLEQRGAPPTFGPMTATALLDGLLNQQAGMMAYNDAAWFVGLMFLAGLPLVLLLPGRAALRAQQAQARASFTKPG
jgi:MFS transporter, DHA2 family, multidrug resistance protein